MHFHNTLNSKVDRKNRVLNGIRVNELIFFRCTIPLNKSRTHLDEQCCTSVPKPCPKSQTDPSTDPRMASGSRCIQLLFPVLVFQQYSTLGLAKIPPSLLDECGAFQLLSECQTVTGARVDPQAPDSPCNSLHVQRLYFPGAALFYRTHVTRLVSTTIGIATNCRREGGLIESRLRMCFLIQNCHPISLRSE